MSCRSTRSRTKSAQLIVPGLGPLPVLCPLPAPVPPRKTVSNLWGNNHDQRGLQIQIVSGSATHDLRKRRRSRYRVGSSGRNAGRKSRDAHRKVLGKPQNQLKDLGE
jgi:hypothetical protein